MRKEGHSRLPRGKGALPLSKGIQLPEARWLKAHPRLVGLRISPSYLNRARLIQKQMKHSHIYLECLLNFDALCGLFATKDG